MNNNNLLFIFTHLIGRLWPSEQMYDFLIKNVCSLTVYMAALFEKQCHIDFYMCDKFTIIFQYYHFFTLKYFIKIIKNGGRNYPFDITKE